MFHRKKTAEYIVDLHSHILPGIDDGSHHMEETRDMLMIAAKEGITHMIATPHYKVGRRNASPEKVASLLEEVQEEADQLGLPISIYQGNEIFYFEELTDRTEAGEISTMVETEYVLVEFSPADQFRYIRNALDHILSDGYLPILAHVERYECMIQEKKHARELKEMGVELQINASSVTGEAGSNLKHYVHQLLKEGLVDYVGTDAHRSEGRAPKIKECAKILYKKYEEAYVDAILYGNAMSRILQIEE